jgi:hypothetical protein
MQNVRDGQDTLVSSLCWPPGALGIRWTAQSLPFQCSTSAPCCLALPTAVQNAGVAQETLSSTLPAGFVMCWRAQRLPFQRSASAAPPAVPTAMHVEREVHETPSR